MKDQIYNGIDYAGEFLFRSAFGKEETLEKIKEHFPRPYRFYDQGAYTDFIMLSKRRLFFCEYNIHCRVYQNHINNDRYQFQLYYTYDSAADSITAASGIVVAILLAFFGGFSNGNWMVSIPIILGVWWVTARMLVELPTKELYSSCEYIQKEMEKYIKMEIEP